MEHGRFVNVQFIEAFPGAEISKLPDSKAGWLELSKAVMISVPTPLISR